MVKSSIKKNFLYNLILTTSGYFFPLLTYPYVSRILGAEGIGTCNFIDSIITYYILFSTLGIGSYGVRKIATCTDDKSRNAVFSNLFVIHAITTSIALIILVITIFFVDKFILYRHFFYVGVFKVFFSLFLTNWFFQGISDFRYITLRGLIVNTIYTGLVFILIHDKDDAIIYYGLSALVIALNAGINWNYGRKYRKFSLKGISVKQYIKPTLSFGLYNILTSLYTTFNIAFLGMVQNTLEVGYYTTATKLYSIIIGMFTALTTVMIPAVSKLVSEGNLESLNNIISKSINLLLIVSIPVIVYCELNADTIILLLSGPGYEGAVVPFRIVILLVFIIGVEQIIIQQVLLASESNNAIIYVCLAGAITGVVLNLLFTPTLGAVGSSISWGCSELIVLVVGVYFVRKVLCISIDESLILKSVKLATGYLLLLLLFCLINIDKWLLFIVSGSVIFIYFIIVNLFVNREGFFIGIWNKLFGKFIYL